MSELDISFSEIVNMIEKRKKQFLCIGKLENAKIFLYFIKERA